MKFSMTTQGQIRHRMVAGAQGTVLPTIRNYAPVPEVAKAVQDPATFVGRPPLMPVR